MPRSFRFEHFQLPPHLARPFPEEEEKGAYARTHKVSPPGEGKLQYGKAHAQTEERLKRKREEHRHAAYEALPGQAGTARKGQRARTRPGTPIGALPATEEPPRAEGFDALWEEAQRNLRAVRQAFSDFSEALARLARLPVSAVRLSRQRRRPT